MLAWVHSLYSHSQPAQKPWPFLVDHSLIILPMIKQVNVALERFLHNCLISSSFQTGNNVKSYCKCSLSAVSDLSTSKHSNSFSFFLFFFKWCILFLYAFFHCINWFKSISPQIWLSHVLYIYILKKRLFLSLLVVFVMYKVIWKIVNKINLPVCILDSGNFCRNINALVTQFVTES